VHVHPYDETTLTQNDDLDTYVRIIEGIRERCDVIVYPTAPFGAAASDPRYAVTRELARRGLISWATVDPGSVNIARYDALARGESGFVYENSIQTLREGLAVCAEFKVVPSYAIYEPGFLRAGAAVAAQTPGLPTPIYRLMFSDEFTFGFPPAPEALAAYAWAMQAQHLSAPTMIAGLGVCIDALIPQAVARGWHVRVGLEDAPFGCTARNVDLVERAVLAITQAGGTPALPRHLQENT